MNMPGTLSVFLLVSWICKLDPMLKSQFNSRIQAEMISHVQFHKGRRHPKSLMHRSLPKNPLKCHQAPSGGVVNSSDLQEAEGLAAWLEAMKFGPKLAGLRGGWGMVPSLGVIGGYQPKMFAIEDVAMIYSRSHPEIPHYFPNSQGIG